MGSNKEILDRTGEENLNNFGSKMKIIKYRNSKDIDVYFPEYNWTFKHNRYTHFKEGSIICPYERRFKGIGYLGEGKYKFRENNKETRCYQEWMKMLDRGYGITWSKKHPTYERVEVCEEWHNFQNFAKWYYENYYEVKGQRMELDKDILYKGNKIYSPETCMIVPQRINNLFLKSDAIRGQYPIGVHLHIKGNYKRLVSQCSIITREGNKERKCLGLFPSDKPFQAFTCYKQFKENYIKEVADEYKDLIPIKLYEAMYKYEVEIND